MAGLVPAIHETQRNGSAWLAGSGPAITEWRPRLPLAMHPH